MQYRKEFESVTISRENGSLVYGVRSREGLYDEEKGRWTPHSAVVGEVLDDVRPEDREKIAAVTASVNAAALEALTAKTEGYDALSASLSDANKQVATLTTDKIAIQEQVAKLEADLASAKSLTSRLTFGLISG